MMAAEKTATTTLLDRLPPVRYHGFDTSEPYLAYARKRYGDRGAFHGERLTDEGLKDLPRFDAVLLFGSELDLPTTLQDVVLARIDRLERPTREVLQVASVLGREFPRELLDRLAATGPDDVHLARLEEVELLQRPGHPQHLRDRADIDGHDAREPREAGGGRRY